MSKPVLVQLEEQWTDQRTEIIKRLKRCKTMNDFSFVMIGAARTVIEAFEILIKQNNE